MASSTQSANAAITTMATRTFHFYLRLPVELQEMVLRQHLVPRKQPVTARMHNLIYGPLLSKLASVGREMYELAVRTYYNCKTFEISRSMLSSAGYVWFRFPAALFGRHLRHIELHIIPPTSFGGLDDYCGLLQQKGLVTEKEHTIRDSASILRLVRPKRTQELGVTMMVPYTSGANGTSYVSQEEVKINFNYWTKTCRSLSSS
jgi:hypothetical protein